MSEELYNVFKELMIILGVPKLKRGRGAFTHSAFYDDENNDRIWFMFYGDGGLSIRKVLLNAIRAYLPIDNILLKDFLSRWFKENFNKTFRYIELYDYDF